MCMTLPIYGVKTDPMGQYVYYLASKRKPFNETHTTPNYVINVQTSKYRKKDSFKKTIYFQSVDATVP